MVSDKRPFLKDATCVTEKFFLFRGEKKSNMKVEFIPCVLTQ